MAAEFNPTAGWGEVPAARQYPLEPGTAPIALVVEDDPDTRQLEVDLLEDAGYEVEASASGEDGVRAARERRPDVMLLDLALPRMSGFDVLQAVKANPGTRDVPVVLVSAYSDLVEDCQARGATACLRKPFGVGELLDQVAQAIRS